MNFLHHGKGNSPLEFLLFIAAYLNINAYPIEGLKKDKVKTVLANTHHLYDPEHFGVACMTALGYRGVFTRPTLAVLHGTAMPAALVEIGFIDSDDAFPLLRNLNDIARAIARGVTDYQCLTTRGENRA